MAEIQWIKLSVNMFDDEKIKLIRTMPEGDSIVLFWIHLLCLAGKINDGGMVYFGQNLAYSDEMLSTILNIPINVVRSGLKVLHQFSMIEISPDGMIDITNWEKHQSTDKMNQMKVQNRERQQRYYYRQKLRELGYTEKEMPNDIEQLKELVEKPNVSSTLANATEVRSKKLDVRSKSITETSNTFGEYQRVLLTDKQLETLKKEFPSDWEYWINKLDSYIESTGKKYKNHLATIRNWSRRDKEKTQNKDINNMFNDIDIKAQNEWLERYGK